MKHTILQLGFVALTLSAGVPLANAADATTAAALPALQHTGKIAFMSGGIGSDESAALRQQMSRYPLVLEFAGHTANGNDYLANIPVQILDAHGHALLNTVADGPFLLATLPDGQYTVTATYHGQTQRRSVHVQGSAHVHEVFLWNM